MPHYIILDQDQGMFREANSVKEVEEHVTDLLAELNWSGASEANIEIYETATRFDYETKVTLIPSKEIKKKK